MGLEITKGNWQRVVLHEGGPDSPIAAIGVSAKGEKKEGSTHGYIIYDSHVPFRLEEELDNATLIADAGNTYQLTGKLPSELAELAGVLPK